MEQTKEQIVISELQNRLAQVVVQYETTIIDLKIEANTQIEALNAIVEELSKESDSSD